jgi:hypothetical protein
MRAPDYYQDLDEDPWDPLGSAAMPRSLTSLVYPQQGYFGTPGLRMFGWAAAEAPKPKKCESCGGDRAQAVYKVRTQSLVCGYCGSVFW